MAVLPACSGALQSDSVQPQLTATYQVGPGQQYTSLAQVAALVKPGDTVAVMGGATYGSVLFDRAGSAGAKITISGVPVNGKRPILSGGTNTVEMAGNHYLLQGFEISGGSSRCIFHHADALTVRHVVWNECPGQGLLGADADSGSLTLEYSEFYRNGKGDRQHQIYMSTDEDTYPGSVFRMQHCYVHDGNGGNNVKSRAERNEIYYNWIEGAMYHELELIGSEAASDPALAREDSDVVGNVFRKITDNPVTRFGGDGTADTNGRYRFVNNTVVTVGGGAVFRLFDGIQSLEAHNNVFVRQGGGAVTLVRDVDAVWTDGHQVIGGAKNWVSSGSVTPAGWTQTLQGSDPGLTDLATGKLWPTASSALNGGGTASPTSPAGYPFTNALALPASQPPRAVLEAVGTAAARNDSAAPTIGAFGNGGTTPTPTPTPAPGPSKWSHRPRPKLKPMPNACATADVSSAIAGAEEEANPASSVLDRSLATRWAGEGLGVTLTLDLGTSRMLCGADLAWYHGDSRVASFSLAVSSDGNSSTEVFTGHSSGTTAQPESYRWKAVPGRYLRIVGQGNTEDQSSSITEAAARATP